MTPTAALGQACAAARPDRPAPHGTSRPAPLVAGLNAEWAVLCSRAASDVAVRAWSGQEPALAPAERLVDVAALAADPAADEVLAALLRLAQTGDRLAGRTLLQLQLGAAINLARRTCHHAAGDVEEAISRAVTFLWEAIAQYPVHRRHGRHADGLALAVLNRLTGHTDNRPGRGQPKAELVLVPREELLDELADRAHPPAAEDPGRQVQRLLRWALHHQVLTGDEAELLGRLHLASEFDQAGVARELGVSHATLRQRSSRATRRLAAAVQRSRALTAAPAPAARGVA